MALELQSPEWWLARLMRRLEDRRWRLRRYDAYYNGDQPLAFASEKFRDAFGSRFRAFSSNFCALVVDATRERLEVQGFRFRDQAGDADLWRIWQENDLDAGSQIAHTEMLIKGIAYTLVEPAVGDDTPRITVEDPLDCIVENDAKDRRRRLAALKCWTDGDGRLVAYVYTPDFVFKYRTKQAPTADPTAPTIIVADQVDVGAFERLETPGEDWPLVNRLGLVPVVPLPNRPRLKVEGQSEIAPVMSNQDAVNKYRADALVASEFAAFRQRWVIGLDIPEDPETHRPLEPFRAAVDRLWTVPPATDQDGNVLPAGDVQPVQFGEFAATALEPYKLMIETEVGHMSSISRIPYHMLLGQPQTLPPSGESIKSSEAGLVRKVGAIAIHAGDGWEETMRLALRAMRDERADIRDAETIWRDAETRNDAVITDAVVKLLAAGVIDTEMAQEMAGLSPEQIARIVKRREARTATGPVEVTPAPTGPQMSGANFGRVG